MLAVAVAVAALAGWGIYGYFFPTALKRAQQAAAARHWAKAEQAFTEHLQQAPRDHAARLELGRVLQQIAPRRAREELNKIPADADEYIPAMREIADFCLAHGPAAEAERALRILQETTPRDPEILLSLAAMYHRAGNYQEALRLALRASELQPERAQTFFLIAELYDDLRRPSEMIAPLERAIELDRDFEAAHLNLSYATLWAGQSDRARSEAQWCLERDPRNVAARCFLAKAARDAGDWDLALAETRHALSISPDDLECRILEAELLLFQREPRTAYHRLRPIYERHRTDRRVVGLLARAATASGLAAEGRRLQQESASLARRGAPADASDVGKSFAPD
jgi:tetratricopeptide (TPR) repeat protein